MARDCFTHNPVLIDLFAGAGGASLGFLQAGVAPVFAADWYEPAARTYRRNFPNVAVWGDDIRTLAARTIAEKVKGRPPIVFAGVPCQGFSTSNRKRHADDPRNFMFLEALRLIRALNPLAVIIENVSGMASLRRATDQTFVDAIVQSLSAVGYQTVVCRLNAVDFGVPQQRRRLFFIGTRHDFPAPKCPTPTVSSVATVRDAISDLPTPTATAYTKPPQTAYQRLMRAGAIVLRNHVAPKHSAAMVAKIAATPPGQPYYPRYKQRKRLAWDEPAPAVISGGPRPQPQLAHPAEPRGLTVREMARLQTFPDTFTFFGGTTAGRVLVGNAVPPMLAQAIAATLCQTLCPSYPSRCSNRAVATNRNGE